MNSFYFQHDNDSMQDEKIIDLRVNMGYEGYGIYWAIIEMLHQNDGYLQMNSKRLAFALQVEEQKLLSVINDYDLFQFEDDIFSSKRLLKQINFRNEVIAKRKAAGSIGGKSKANAKQMLSKVVPKERKGKERKEKDSKVKERKENDMNSGDKSPVFKECITIYFNFYEKLIGIKPAFGGAEGKHLKELISKIEISMKNSGREISDSSIRDTFFSFLNSLPEFYKNKIDVKILNSKYDGIVAEIRKKSGVADKDAWENVTERRKREREAAAANG